MSQPITRGRVRTPARPVPIGELLDAWLAVQRGQFRHSTATPPVPAPATVAWQPAPGEVPVLVVGCGGSVGASTVALLLAGAIDRARVVDCAPASHSGLAGASTAELGEAANGWLAGRRDTTLIQRRHDQPPTPQGLPAPLPGDPGWLTVVDSWWEPRQLLTQAGWLADLARTCPRVVLVTRASIPGMARLEAVLATFGPERCWAVVVASPHRLPSPVERSLGSRTVQLRASGRLFSLPPNPVLAMSGITTEPLPRAFAATAHQLLEGLLP
ncbi:MAG: hypothetical protein QM779_15340 [Propionicimonas sp.]|uniref:hypothetical protein n=1 Tax=Propionicimonas sp. TaxID=1955623 RepID=UPI003D0E9EB9